MESKEENQEPQSSKHDCKDRTEDSIEEAPTAEQSSTCKSDDTQPSDESVTVATLQQELAEAQEALAAAQDQSLRAIAEAENTRKRALREVDNARKFALEDFARELLPSLDNFDAAIASAEEADIELSAIEGFKLSVKSLLDTLERNGIVGFDPLGEVFDPQRHKALTLIPHPHAEPGSVVNVVRKGYLLNERLVREAEVVVSKEIEQDEESTTEESS